MPAESILVIAVDGLRAAALGAYGNTAFTTPALDQLAAESLLFDWCYADAVELPTIYRSLWHFGEPLAKSLVERGYTATLVTDEPAVLNLEGATHFHDCVLLPIIEAVRAEDVSHTALARLFAAASDQIEASQAGPHLLWVHSQGMYGPWDAPLDLQEELLAREEGDPPPADALDPPDLMLDGGSDPDASFRWSCAYAAQVMTLDTCIADLCRTLGEAGRDNWLVLLCGVRGFPLGEHGRVGGVDGRLYAEQLHVPMLWRFPDASGRLVRSGKLASLADLSPSLLARVRGESHIPDRDALIAAGPAAERLIRTADWSLRCESTGAGNFPGDDSCCQLFVRPDDLWEANDVASLCPEVVEGLLARLGEIPAR